MDYRVLVACHSPEVVRSLGHSFEAGRILVRNFEELDRNLDRILLVRRQKCIGQRQRQSEWQRRTRCSTWRRIRFEVNSGMQEMLKNELYLWILREHVKATLTCENVPDLEVLSENFLFRLDTSARIFQLPFQAACLFIIDPGAPSRYTHQQRIQRAPLHLTNYQLASVPRSVEVQAPTERR